MYLRRDGRPVQEAPSVTTMTDTARARVLRLLEHRYELHAIDEQRFYTTEPQKASDAHDAFRYVVRALEAEDKDPAPRPPCTCIECNRAYAAGRP